MSSFIQIYNLPNSITELQDGEASYSTRILGSAVYPEGPLNIMNNTYDMVAALYMLENLSSGNGWSSWWHGNVSMLNVAKMYI